MNTCSVEGCTNRRWARSLCAPHYSTWWRGQRRYTTTCPECGGVAHCRLPANKYCSRSCATAAGNRKRRFPREVALYTGPPTPKPPPVHVRTAHRLTSGQCRVCQQWFCSFHTDITCSPVCQEAHARMVKQVGRDRRRARKRNAYVADVNRKQVYERDGYRCHLCGEKTDPSKSVPHPRAPTIDHVIPLAAHGTHEPSNCRTACFLCNATKGDRGGGEQLLLIA